MTSALLKQLLLRNAAEISRLHAKVHESARRRSKGAKAIEEWKIACEEFHQRYDELAFPGGYEGAHERILAGDSNTIETALCFLECRPYFFRSGYMYTSLLRKVKQAHLSPEQELRLQVVLERVIQWRANRRAKSAA